MLLNIVKAMVFILSFIRPVCQGLSTSKHNSTQYENALLEDLFNGYNKQVRPVLNWSHPIRVGFGVALSEILELDAKNQVLTTNVWIRQRWNDEFLTWNCSQYGGITSINIDPEYLWKPDITLQNNVESSNNGEQYLFKTKLRINSQGSVTWFSTNKLATSCPISIQKFPFDTQQCTFKFAPWTYTGDKLELEFWDKKSPRLDLSIYSKNAEFDLQSVEGNLNRSMFACCPQPFYDITYTLVLHRKPLFYLNNLIIPCIVLELVTVMSFLFPPETGERISLVVTVLLGMTVFMIVFTGFIPASSNVTPMIGKYFNTVLCEVAACLLATFVPLRLQHLRPGTEMPNWLKVIIFDYLAVLMCFKCKTPKKLSERFSKKYVLDASKNSACQNHAVVIDIENGVTELEQFANNELPNTITKHATSDDRESCRVVQDGIVTIKNYFNKIERADELSREWKDAVAIVDRLFLWIFLLTFAASSAMLLTVL